MLDNLHPVLVELLVNTLKDSLATFTSYNTVQRGLAMNTSRERSGQSVLMMGRLAPEHTDAMRRAAKSLLHQVGLNSEMSIDWCFWEFRPLHT